MSQLSWQGGTCLSLHAQLTEIRFGRKQDLQKIEAETKRIQSSRRFTYDDVERIRNSKVWNADQFGYWPSRSDVGHVLESTDWDLWHLPRNEGKAISSLLAVFRQLEPVSVILRFVAPKHYGILSPPVEKLLELSPSRSRREKYLAYLKDLRALRDQRKFTTAAQVDMSLWVLQVGVLERRLPRHEELQRAFEQDLMLREIRVRNVAQLLFKNMSRTALAEALLATNVELSGQIAGIEFERSVKRLLRARPDDKLANLVKEACRSGQVAAEFAMSWGEAVRTRNKAVHSDGAPRPDEVRRLIAAMKSAENLASVPRRRNQHVRAPLGPATENE